MESKLDKQFITPRKKDYNFASGKTIVRQVEEFEEKLREDNLELFNQFRLKDIIVKENIQAPKS